MIGWFKRLGSAIAHIVRGVVFLLPELWAFMRVRKKYWMAPVFLVLLVFALLVGFVQSSFVAQFIYVLF